MSLESRLSAVSQLLSSNAVATALLFLGLYVLSQWMSPAEIGKYSLFSSIALAIYPAQVLRYDQAIPLANTDATAKVIVALCLLLTAGISLLMVGGLSLASGADGWLTSKVIREYLPLLALATAGLALANVAQMLALRVGALTTLASARVVRAVVFVTVQISLVALVSSNAISAIAGEISANWFQAALMCYLLAPHLPDLRLLRSRGILRRFWTVAIAYRTFATVNLLHVLSYQGMVAGLGALLGTLYGAEVLGQFYLMRRMVMGSIGLLTTSLNQWGLSAASRFRGDPGQLLNISLYVAGVLGSATLAAALALLFLGPQIFTIAFGQQWALAGQLGAASFSLILLEPIASALSFVPVFLRRQTYGFAWALAQGTVPLGAILIAHATGADAVQAVLAFSVAESLIILAFLAWIWRACVHDREGRCAS